MPAQIGSLEYRAAELIAGGDADRIADWAALMGLDVDAVYEMAQSAGPNAPVTPSYRNLPPDGGHPDEKTT